MISFGARHSSHSSPLYPCSHSTLVCLYCRVKEWMMAAAAAALTESHIQYISGCRRRRQNCRISSIKMCKYVFKQMFTLTDRARGVCSPNMQFIAPGQQQRTLRRVCVVHKQWVLQIKNKRHLKFLVGLSQIRQLVLRLYGPQAIRSSGCSLLTKCGIMNVVSKDELSWDMIRPLSEAGGSLQG